MAVAWCWRSVLAAAVAVLAYPGFLVWYLIATYLSAFPTFTPSWERGRDPNALLLFLTVPAMFALVLFALVLFSTYSRLRIERVAEAIARFYGFGVAAVVGVSIMYAVANLRNWDNADAIVSSTLLVLLLCVALAVGIRSRSIALTGWLVVGVAPVWLAGVIGARVLAVWFSLLCIWTFGRFLVRCFQAARVRNLTERMFVLSSSALHRTQPLFISRELYSSLCGSRR